MERVGAGEAWDVTYKGRINKKNLNNFFCKIFDIKKKLKAME